MKSFVITTVLLMSSICSYSQEQLKFKFVNMEGAYITPESLPQGQPLIVFYFDMYCESCQQQAQWIQDDLEKFNDITLLWVTSGDIYEPDNFQAFEDKYFKDAPNVIMCADYEFLFDGWFGYS